MSPPVARAWGVKAVVSQASRPPVLLLWTGEVGPPLPCPRAGHSWVECPCPLSEVSEHVEEWQMRCWAFAVRGTWVGGVAGRTWQATSMGQRGLSQCTVKAS